MKTTRSVRPLHHGQRRQRQWNQLNKNATSPIHRSLSSDNIGHFLFPVLSLRVLWLLKVRNIDKVKSR